MFAANKSAAPSGAVFIEDVFSSYVFSGTGAVLTLTDNIDRTKGALDIFKGRSGATDWAWYDTVRGVGKDLISNSTAAQTTQAQGVTAVSSTGITIGTLAKINTSGATYVKYTFRESAKFFKVTTKSHANGAASTVDLSALGTVGLVYVKRTDSTGSWLAWHRSLTTGKLLYLEQTAAESTDASISVSGTTLTIASAVATGTYSIIAFAHDTSAEGLIQCGSLTTDGSAVANITLGWEPQWILVKNTQTAGNNWFIWDTARGWTADGATGDKYLIPNDSSAEGGGADYGGPNATGFTLRSLQASNSFIYMAIRRGPMRPPTSGTQVLKSVLYTGNASDWTLGGAGFAPDLLISLNRTGGGNHGFYDRLRGAQWLSPTLTNAEANSGGEGALTSDGVTFVSNYAINTSGHNFVANFLKRYPGVFDIVCYTGTDFSTTTARPHNLQSVPELQIIKRRDSAAEWIVVGSGIGNQSAGDALFLNQTTAVTAGYLGAMTLPTSSMFYTKSVLNTAGATYVAYLFATKAGISKIGSYVGNGTSQTIDCGFAGGARFVLIKAAEGETGNWLVFDTVRGIVDAADPYLSLNTTNAEGSSDVVDPNPTGFTIVAGPNATGKTYIYLAIA